MCDLRIGHIGRKAIVDFMVDGEWKPMYQTCVNGSDEPATWVLQGEVYCDECFLEALKELIYNNGNPIDVG
jgi:hypothetical protein